MLHGGCASVCGDSVQVRSCRARAPSYTVLYPRSIIGCQMFVCSRVIGSLSMVGLFLVRDNLHLLAVPYRVWIGIMRGSDCR